MELIYGNRSWSEVIFREELARLSSERARLHVRHVLTRPPGNWAGLQGRIAGDNLPELIRGGRLPEGQPEAGFVGMLFGVPIYSTTEVTNVNSDVDRCGAMFTREAMAFIQLRPITVEYDYDASGRVTEVVVTTAYGVGEVVDGYGVPIETDD